MDHCDVLIVGGGPAGSTCARALRNSGLDVLILDRAQFPRDKVCAGWITPRVLKLLEIDPAEYSTHGVFQPITKFRVSCMGDEPVTVHFDEPVSYGIRRCEFDTYLLKRCGARVREGVRVTSIERQDRHWILNGEFRARMLVGAGGHFCPVARFATEKDDAASLIAAQESEFFLPEEEKESCPTEPGTVELAFCRDFKGYGWVFRKQGVLNVGLGRMGSKHLPAHMSDFLKQEGMPSLPSGTVRGHAYLAWGHASRRIVEDGMLLVGDAAGTASSHSGEGIAPAIESGFMAAQAILNAAPDFAEHQLAGYASAMRERFDEGRLSFSALAEYLPERLRSLLGARLLRSPRFCRDVVIKGLFCTEPSA